MISCPCKGCQDRKVGCHSLCDAYKAFKADCDRINEIKNKERQKAGFGVHNYYVDNSGNWKSNK